jgi:GntR family transcriptional repressor for pyruvate dehydrogenase complex
MTKTTDWTASSAMSTKQAEAIDRVKTKFTPIGNRKKLSDDIFDQIKSMIFSKKLKPGEKLPNERDLSRILNVGRPSLREALSQLTFAGLLENRKQHGYFVRPLTEEIVSSLKDYLEHEIDNLIDFIPVRRSLDMAIAQEAMKNGTETDFRKIKENIGDGYEFHVAIAEATHNLILIHLTSSMHRLLSTLSYITKSKEDSQINAAKQHQKIYDAIVRGNSGEVRRAIEEHLKNFIDEAKEKHEEFARLRMKGNHETD